MTFKDKYKQEMDAVNHTAVLDEKTIKMIDANSIVQKNMHYRFGSVSIAAILMLVIIVFNFETLVAYATSLFGNYGLYLGNKEIVLEEIEPLELDYDRFMNDEKAQKNGANYYYHYEDFKDGLGIELPGNTFLEYEEICVDVILQHNVGHLSLDFVYEDEQYHMNGRFAIADYADEVLGYGEERRAYYVYEYAEGEKAYFVKHKENKFQMVYFVEDKYVFQLFVENDREGTETAKEILDLMAKESIGEG